VPARFPTLVATGLAAGFLAGVFGIGGGIVIVPMLVAGAAYPAKSAMATSLAAMLFTALAAGASHAQAGQVAWTDAVLIGVPATAGAVAGAWLHQRIATRAVVLGFSVLLAVTAARLAL
jgi:uncharacterized protein